MKKCFNHPNKLQIETAQEYLTSQLLNKSEKIAEKNLKKDIKQYEKDAIKIVTMLKPIKEKLIDFRKKISLNNNLELSESGYGGGLDINIDEIPSTYQKLLEAIQTRDSNHTKNYEPKGEKEIQKNINRFILELKLGTALMKDMSKIETEIKNLK